jgi:hypothetical protein
LCYDRSTLIQNIVMTISLLPKLRSFPESLPLDGAIGIEFVEGIPIFRASSVVQTRIEALLAKQQDSNLSQKEEEELDCYEEIDDYLSFVNRTVRNMSIPQSAGCANEQKQPSSHVS